MYHIKVFSLPGLSSNVRFKMLQKPITVVKRRWKHAELEKEAGITPDTTEAIMKNIRGIPYLIQVSQISCIKM